MSVYKKLKQFFFLPPLLLVFLGCATTSVSTGRIRSEKLVESEVSIQDWKTNYSVEASRFADAKKDDVIKITVVPQKSDVYSVYLYNLQWKNLLFSQLECEPKSYSLTKDEGNGLFSRIKLDPSVSEYTITITLTQEEADILSTDGFLISGSGFILKSLEYTYTKPEPLKNLPFEEQYELKAKKRANTIKRYSDYKLPFIYITTKNRQEVKTKEYYEAVVDVVNCDEKYFLPQDFNERTASVKVRGNSSSWEKPFPYRIKFNKGQNLLGLNGGEKYKSWVLLKTWSIGTDYIGFNLAREIYKTSRFDYYASDCTPVHVFENDEYKGLYLLCEQNQVGKTRVSVNENEKGSKSEKTGYLIEMDNYAWEDKIVWDPSEPGFRINSKKWKKGIPWKGKEDYHFDLDYTDGGKHNELKDINGVSKPICWFQEQLDGFTVEYNNDSFSLKNDIYSDEQAAFIANYMNCVWDICYYAIEKGEFYKLDKEYNLVKSDCKNAKEVCSAVIDLESLCNEIILEELVRDNDVGAGSLYMAVDFTVQPGQKYEKLTFECPWDFNWGYGQIKYDVDGGKYWDDKQQYFACVWQSPFVNEGEITNGTVYERSNPWFILFNNAPWFRQMLREKWEQIGPDNLKAVLQRIKSDSEQTVKELGWNCFEGPIDFVSNRIDYIDTCLWK